MFLGAKTALECPIANSLHHRKPPTPKKTLSYLKLDGKVRIFFFLGQGREHSCFQLISGVEGKWRQIQNRMYDVRMITITTTVVYL